MQNRIAVVRRNLPEHCHLGVPDLHPVLERVYLGRGVKDAADVDFDIQGMLPPTQLLGSDKAAELLYEMLLSQKRVLIIGDFDADGATSSALAVRGLRAMGFEHVSYLVPNRFEFGYGLTPEIVAVAENYSPDLIVTVDNGIASVDGVLAAKVRGYKVLITDHHLPGERLPEADVIVNPNQPDCPFPSKGLAGVGVVFYLLVALRKLLRDVGWFDQQSVPVPNLSNYLDLVALGTVADLVPLDQNNRILVQQGMNRIRSGRCNPGISALIAVGKRSQHRVVSSDMGFVVGPRLNAAGRLDDMSIGIECLLTDEFSRAQRLALQLDRLNAERKKIESEMKQEALAALEQVELNDAMGAGICLYDPSWHQGVTGIVASRVKERFNRPVVIFASSEESGILKGSARSVNGYHIKEALDAIALTAPGLMVKYGGHAMAAGLSLKEQDYPSFKQLFQTYAEQRLSEEQLRNIKWTDGPLSGQEFSIDLAQLIRSAAPWGQGFTAPVFDGRFSVKSARIVGGVHLKMELSPAVASGDLSIDAIAFNQAEDPIPEPDSLIEIVYGLDVNEFRGEERLQLMVEHIKLVQD